MKNKSTIKTWLMISLSFLFLITCISAYLQSSSKSDESKQSITLTNAGFDTPIQFEATCTKNKFDEYVTIVTDTFTQYNKYFDQYHEYEGINNVYTLNQRAKYGYIEVDSSLIDCIQKAKEIYDINSQFDITQGAVLNLWHEARETSLTLNEEGKDGILPNDDAIKEAMKHTGFDKLEIKNNSIRYLDDQLQLDLGGIAKGYAAQKCKERLNEAGLTNGFINAGGNAVLLGEKQEGWKIGIQDPDQTTSLLRFETKDAKAIVTSGDYQRYFTIQERRYSHIIDPTTGYPSNYVRSVTVITDDSTLADGISTTLFNLSYEDGIKLIQELQKEYDIEAIWVLDKNKNITSDIECDDYIIKLTSGIKENVSLS